MNHNLLSFTLGFISAGILCWSGALLYYLRARRRVRSIQSAIQRYQEAHKIVGEAVNHTFAKQ